jgi:hypothetical protein
MNRVTRTTIFALAVWCCAPVAAGVDDAAMCTALLEEERMQLADYALEVELARSRLAAFEKICVLVDGLWEAEAIPRMTWLEARHDRDAARLDLEAARLIQERQEAYVSQIELACEAPEDDRARKIREARRRYLETDCERLAKAVEIAKINLEFNREWLASIRELREGDSGTATAQDVILAELDVKLEEQRLADAKARVEACREHTAATP